jgi:hypothetical protein
LTSAFAKDRFPKPLEMFSHMWPLSILDTTDVPGAGGYHDDDGGLVQGCVFAADAMQYGEAWTVNATHELLEMLGARRQHDLADPAHDLALLTGSVRRGRV